MTKPLILVVEENSVMQKLYRHIFERDHGDEFQLRIVASGEDALEFLPEDPLKKIPVDLLVLDWNLPGIAGIDVLKRVRAQESTKALPVIVLTASEIPGDRLAAFRHGADQFQLKGFHIDELLAQIRQLLSRGRPSRGLLSALLMLFAAYL